MQKKSPPKKGMHFTLDGYGCNPKQLANLDTIYDFLEHCPDLIEMTKIMPPYVFKYHGKVPEDWGISGFVLGRPVVNISIHTFPKRGYISLDIFSTRDFDYSQAIAYATETFDIARHEVELLDREWKFPREVRTVERLLRQEREQTRGRRFAKEPPDEAA